MEEAKLIAAWRAVINDPKQAWVLFEHGTCVTLPQPAADPAALATAVLRENGPVVPGTHFGDFNVFALEDGRGWLVTSHHQDIRTFIGPDEVTPGTDDMIIGLIGRAKRSQDAEELRLLHVEDPRHA